MKKQIILASAVISIIFAITACGTTENEDNLNSGNLGYNTEDECEGSSCGENQGTANTYTSDLEVLIDQTSDYGSSGALQDESLNLEDMLLYAIQDEYAARMEYQEIIKEFNVSTPYTNIIKSEETHISELTTLYEAYGIALPEDTASDHVIIPDSLLDAATTGVQAEINNIAMYDLFLEQDIPDDVREIFIDLRDASIKHLSSFEKQVSKLS